MFSTLKKEIETTNKRRVTAVRERDELRRRSDKAEEENSLLKKQVGGASGGWWQLVLAVTGHSLVAAVVTTLLPGPSPPQCVPPSSSRCPLGRACVRALPFICVCEPLQICDLPFTCMACAPPSLHLCECESDPPLLCRPS